VNGCNGGNSDVAALPNLVDEWQRAPAHLADCQKLHRLTYDPTSRRLTHSMELHSTWRNPNVVSRGLSRRRPGLW
jgi:hypothetical protein